MEYLQLRTGWKEVKGEHKNENECLFNDIVSLWSQRKREHLKRLKLRLTSTSKSHIKLTSFWWRAWTLLATAHHGVEAYIHKIPMNNMCITENQRMIESQSSSEPMWAALTNNPQTEWFINNRKTLLIALEAGKLRIVVLAYCLMRAHSLAEMVLELALTS